MKRNTAFLTLIGLFTLLCTSSSCHKEDKELTNFTTLELGYGQTKTLALPGQSLSVKFIDLKEERCANCTTCYKPNGIYADVMIEVNNTPQTLRVRTCTLTEEISWEQVQKDRNVSSINSTIQAGVVKLIPSDTSLVKSSYSTKIIFNY